MFRFYILRIRSSSEKLGSKMKEITAVILLLVATYGYSEPYTKDRAVVCADPKAAFESLIRDYKEKPIWIGVDQEQNKFVLVTNKETGTWTFLQFNDKAACALGIGTVYEIVYTGPTI